MSTKWSSENDGYYIDGPYWGARVWEEWDEGEGCWMWEAWCDGGDDEETEAAEGESKTKVLAMNSAEKFLDDLRVDLDDR